MSKKILSLLLVLSMVFAGIPASVFAAGPSEFTAAEQAADGPAGLQAASSADRASGFAPVGKSSPGSNQPDQANPTSNVGDGLEKFEPIKTPISDKLGHGGFMPGDKVTFIVEMKKAPLLAKGFTKNEISTRSAAASKYRDEQITAIRSLEDRLIASFGKEEAFKIGFEYTLAITGVSVTTAYGNKAEIAAMPDVANVYVSPVFELPEPIFMGEVLQPYTGNATTMIGSDILNKTGYTGKGMRIAILDTGIKLDHPNFAPLPDDKLENPLTLEEIQSVWDNLNARRTNGLSANAYYNTKIPFIFNYSALDFNVAHSYAHHDHGTHVAGIAAANKIDESEVIGVAPDAQLIVMQVFQSNGGASFEQIMAALEDCVYLNVDAANLSLGSPAGFTDDNADSAFNKVMQLFMNTDIHVLVASGNETHNAYMNRTGINMSLKGNPDIGVAANPSTYKGAVGVASVNNDMHKMLYITAYDKTIPYDDTGNNDHIRFITRFKEQTLDYVTVPGTGTAADYANLDVSGKVALVMRGGISFPEKQSNARDAGAIACIVYNNQNGMIHMQINQGDEDIPCVMIDKRSGEFLAERSEGSFTVCDGEPIEIKTDIEISGFSSWGVTPDLRLKPEIAGVGGQVYSCTDREISGSDYASWDGTSMATPQISGAVTIIKQYFEKNHPEITGDALRRVIANVMMSTAQVIMNGDVEYSPRAQGAGLVDLVAATTAKGYLTGCGVTEDRPKGEMGDDAQRSGLFTFNFKVNNIADEALTYRLDSSVLTETLYAGNFIENSDHALEAKAEFIADGKAVKEVTVEAGEAVELTVRIQMTDADKDYLEQFPNGIYVEGFIYVDDVNEENVDLNMPFIGFYGDWSDNPVFDEEKAFEASLFERLLFTMVSQVGTNPYIRSGKSGSMYNAVSYSAPLVEMDFGMLRNAKKLIFSVTDKQTGEEYFNLKGDNITKTYYSNGQIIPTFLVNTPENTEVWDGKNKKGELLPSGTKVSYNVVGFLDDGNDAPDDMFSIDLTVDSEFPVVENAAALQDFLEFREDRTYLTLKLKDDQYIAAVLFVAPNGKIMGKYEVDNIPGETYTATYDISGFGNEFSIVAADYACNETEIEATINLGEHNNDHPTPVTLDKDRLYGCETFDMATVEAGWFSANKADFSEPKNETFDSMNRYYSGEFVNGYLIAQSAVTGDIELITPGSTYWPGETIVKNNYKIGEDGCIVLYDMAIDYSGKLAEVYNNMGDNKNDILFAVGWHYSGDRNNDGKDDGYNALFRIVFSPSGYNEIEECGKITGVPDKELLTLGITTEGDAYGIGGDGCLYSVNLKQEWNDEAGANVISCTKIGETDFVHTDKYGGVNVIQSMGYDHNTDTMYWYAHSQIIVGNRYDNINITYAVDLSTGKCTEIGTYGPGGQTCLFVPNDKKSDLFEMDVQATGMSLEPYSMIMVEGQTVKLDVKWQPWNAKAADVTWASSDSTIAAVDDYGFVTAVKTGDAVITATADIQDWDGTVKPYSTECKVNVVPSEDGIYSFLIQDFKVSAPSLNWVTYSDKTPRTVTDLGKQKVFIKGGNIETGEDITVDAMWQGGAYYNGYVYTDMVVTYIEGSVIHQGTAVYKSKVNKGTSPAETTFGEPERIAYIEGVELVNLGFDYTTSRLYAVDKTTGGIGLVDTDNGDYELLCTFNGDCGGPVIATAMTVIEDGTIIIADMQGTLYTANPDTGYTTRLGSIGRDTWYYGAMAYDYNTGSIYWNPCMGERLSPLYIVRIVPDEWEPERLTAVFMDMGDVSTKAGVEQTVMFAIPDEEPEAQVIPVESIEITNGDKVQGLVGGRLQLTTETVPARPSIRTRKWISSDENVVTVDKYGVLTYTGTGTATVTVSITNRDPEADGGPFTDTIDVQVYEATGDMTAFLSSDTGTWYYDMWLSMKDYDLIHTEVAKSAIGVYSLRTGIYYDGYFYAYRNNGDLMRIDADDYYSYWTIGAVSAESDHPVLTGMTVDYTTGTVYAVTSDGRFGALDLNTAVFTEIGSLNQPVYAIAADKNGIVYGVGSPDAESNAKLYTIDKQTADCTVIIDMPCSVYPGQYNSQMTYDFGTDRLYLNASANSSYGMYMILLNGDTPEVISLGNIALHLRGEPKVGEAFLGLLAVKTTAEDDVPAHDVNGILMAKTFGRVAIGNTIQLDAAARPSNAADASLSWTSSDDSIAAVDQDGNVTGIAPGSAMITVTSNAKPEYSASCNITVIKENDKHSTAYSAVPSKDAIYAFNPELPAQTAEKLATVSGKVTAVTMGEGCLYYIVDNNTTEYLYSYDFASEQSSVIAPLEMWTPPVEGMSYDRENNLLYVLGGFYLYQYNLAKLSDLNPGDSLRLSGYMMDPDYGNVTAVAAADDGYVYYTATDYSGAVTSLKRVDKLLHSENIEIIKQDLGFNTAHGHTEMAYDSSIGKFYITDVTDNLYIMTVNGVNDVVFEPVDCIGSGLKISGMAIKTAD